MKKYQFLVLCMIAVFAVVAMQAVSRAAEVISVQGSVQVQSPSDHEWKKAEKGMQLVVGDMIRTARSSVAEVALDTEKKNTIRVEPKTIVTLNSATADTLDRLDLAKGKVYANLENIKSGLSFEVNTPSAVAGVRGSALSVYVERDSDEIVAYKDTVFIKAYDADKKLISETTLPEGFKTFVERFAEPGTFSQIGGREFKHFDSNMDDLSSNVEGKMSARVQAEEARKEAKKAKEQERMSERQVADQANDQQGLTKELTDIKEVIEDKKTQEVIEERLKEITEDHGISDPFGADGYCPPNGYANGDPDCN